MYFPTHWLDIDSDLVYVRCKMYTISQPSYNIKIVFPGMGFLKIEIRLSWDSLNFLVGISRLVERYHHTGQGFDSFVCSITEDWNGYKYNVKP